MPFYSGLEINPKFLHFDFTSPQSLLEFADANARQNHTPQHGLDAISPLALAQ